MLKICEICGKPMKVFAKGDSYTYWRCSNCHWFSTSSNSREKPFDYNEYETFDANLDNKEELALEARKMLQYKFDLLRIKPRNFLDIGCSEGIFVRAYNELMCIDEGYGIEVAEPKIQRARKEGLKVYDFENMPKKTFDFVLCRHVIEHIDRPMAYIETMLKYVNKGGTICIETPNNENWDNLLNGNTVREDRFCRDLYPPTHVCGFTPKTFRVVGKSLDLVLIKLMTYNGDNYNWCYSYGKSDDKLNLKYRMREKINLGGNIAVFYRKMK